MSVCRRFVLALVAVTFALSITASYPGPVYAGPAAHASTYGPSPPAAAHAGALAGRGRSGLALQPPLTITLKYTLADTVAPGASAPSGRLDAAANVRYVALDGTCGGAAPCYGQIQPAVDAAEDGDLIKVAAGTYAGVQARAGMTQSVYISRTITIRGGYTTTNQYLDPPDLAAYPTVVDASAQGRVFYIAGPVTVTLEHLTITGGDAAAAAGTPSPGSSIGGGLYADQAHVTIQNSQIVSNSGAYAGGVCARGGSLTLGASTVVSNNGGIDARDGTATLSGNVIRSNDAYGVLLEYTTATLDGNAIYSNTSQYTGGGVVAQMSTVTFTNNILSGNTALEDGGAVYLRWDAATLIGNTISGNTASRSGGGLAILESPATFAGNVVTGNVAGAGGGGLFVGYGMDSRPITLTNNVFAGNTSGSEGGGLLAVSTPATMINTVIVDNQSGQDGSGCHIDGFGAHLVHTTIARNRGGDGYGLFAYGGSSQVVLTNTLVYSQEVGIYAPTPLVEIHGILWYSNTANYSGPAITITHALTGSPVFVDPDAGDYRLRLGSAAIDAGLQAGVAADVVGWPRDAWPDLGAYEYRPFLEGISVTGPATATVDAAAILTAAAVPLTATLPITYHWQAAGQASVTHVAEALSDVVSFTWGLTGTWAITVTAVDASGSEASATHAITVSAPPEPDDEQWYLYLPLLRRDDRSSR
jgi:hypothetical protein